MIIFAAVTILMAIYMFLFAFTMNTKNVRSAICFKLIPFLIALWLLGIALSLFGVVHTPLTPEKVQTTNNSTK